MAAHRIITTEPQLDDLVAELLDQPRYAVDTEFHRERTYYPKVALVQIAWADGVALVDPLAVSLQPLAKVLAGDGLAIMHAATQDLEVLDAVIGLPRGSRATGTASQGRSADRLAVAPAAGGAARLCGI
jgi:ribonuclease D